MSDLELLTGILERSGIGHGTRDDSHLDPPGTAVQIECGDDESTTEWWFDADGRLVTVNVMKEG